MPRNKFEDAYQAAHPNLKYEALKIPYVVTHNYTPDWIDPFTGAIYETKGRFTSSDRSKHKYLKSQHPTLDVTIVFQRPHTPIRKGSKTTYAMWCDKNQIKWQDGSNYK